MKRKSGETDYRTVAKKVSTGDSGAVYLFYGTESFLIKEMIQFMENKLIDSASRDFNYSTYNLSETPVQEVLQDAETFPFMGDRRLIIAKESYIFTGSKPNVKVEHDLDALVQYLESPATPTTLVFVTERDKLDERKKIVKKLRQMNAIVPFNSLKNQELILWLVKRAHRYHVQLEQEAAEQLVLMVGDSLHFLQSEIEKMAYYVGEKGTIDVEVVRELCTRTMEQDVFTLIDRVAKVEIKEAFSILYDLLKKKEEPIKILNLCARQFRNMLLVKILSAKGYSQKQMASNLKLHPFAVKLAYEQANRFKERDLKKILSILAEEDYRMKTGQVDKVWSLEMFIHTLQKIQIKNDPA